MPAVSLLLCCAHMIVQSVSIFASLVATGCLFYETEEPVPPGGGAEILRNGGFEELDATGTWVTDWENLDGNPEGEIELVSAPVVSGDHALRWHIGAAGDGYEYFIIQNQIDPALFVRGARYEMSGSYMIDHVGGEISFSYIVRGEGDEPDIGNDWDNTHPAAAHVWDPFAFEFTMPSNADPANFMVYLHVIKWTSADLNLWLDDVSLHRTN